MCGPWASSISITWELGRNANPQALPQTKSETLGWETNNKFYKPL